MKERRAGPKHALAVFLLLLMGFFLYSNSFSNELVWDDIDIIQPDVLRLEQIPRFFSLDFWRRTHLYRGIFRPFLLTSLSVDFYFWENDSAGYHITNTLLHIVNGVLFYALLYLTFGEAPLALLGSLLFIAHPVNTEALLWVKNRGELAAATFVLASQFLFVKAWRTGGKSFPLLYGLSLLSMVFALLFKETALVLPFLLTLYCLFFPRGKRRSVLLLFTLPFFLMGAFHIALKGFFLPKLLPPEPWYPEVGLYAGILTVPVTLAVYLRILLFPIPLCADRPFVFPRSLLEADTLSSLFFFFSVIVFLAFLIRNRKRTAYGLLWILVALVPVSNIVLLISRPIAEQRAYLASAGFCIFIATLPVRTRRGKPLCLFICIMLAFFSASIIRRNRDWRNSFAFWEKVVKQSPRSSRGRTNLGNVYAQRGWYDRAIEQQRMALRLKPYDPLIHINLGGSYLGKEAFSAALSEFQQALALDPASFQAHHNLGVLHEKRGRRQKATEHFQKALEINPGLFKTRSNLGVLYDKEGLYEEAERELKRALKARPENCMIRNNLAVVYKNMGRYSEALMELDRAEACDSLFPGSYLNRGAVFSVMGKNDKAIAEYRKVLERDPASREARFNLGQAYAREKRFREAQSEFKTLLGADPTHVQARYMLALCYAVEARYKEAQAEIAEVLRFAPGHKETQLVRSLIERGGEADELEGRGFEMELSPMAVGWMHEAQGEYREAAEQYKEEVKLHPLAADGYNALGRSYYKLGELDRAELQFREALKRDPRNADAHSNLGIVYGSMGKHEQAVEVLTRALDLRPGLAEAHDSLGLIFARMGRLEEAEAELRRALEENPRFANAHNNLGMVYAERGLLEKAREEWEKALEIDPGHRGAKKNLKKLGKDNDAHSPAGS